MEKALVTGTLWNGIYQYASAYGYAFETNVPSRKFFSTAPNHPVQLLNWFDAVKWCNLRSEMEARTPVYYTNPELTAVYRAGELAPYVNWSANGYRLPTEAEWEKAARGGLVGKRFPWGDTIIHNQANYYSRTNDLYDISLTRGGHPLYGEVKTSPVGAFPPNGFGLFNMAGNIAEWCWDWGDLFYYGSSATANPRGPTSGIARIMRDPGGAEYAWKIRCAYRNAVSPGNAFAGGFRCVRGL